MENNVLEVCNISKSYSLSHRKEQVHAVKNLSFTAKAGEIIGLVGPNGAGKSTTIKMIAGILRPTAGRISINNISPQNPKDLNKVLSQLGVVFGNRSSLWFNLPSIESLYLARDIYDIPKLTFQERLKSFAEILEANELLNKPVRTMSFGERIKIEILFSILHSPKLLILDEPTIGLDIVAKKHFRQILRKLANESKTCIILTTHDLIDVERVCDKIILINHGEKMLDFKNQDFEKLFSDYRSIIVEDSTSIHDKPHETIRSTKDIQDQESACRDDLRAFLIESYQGLTKYFVKCSDQEKVIDLIRKLHPSANYRIEKISVEDLLNDYYKK